MPLEGRLFWSLGILWLLVSNYNLKIDTHKNNNEILKIVSKYISIYMYIYIFYLGNLLMANNENMLVILDELASILTS